MTLSNTPLSITNATVTYPDGLSRFTALDSATLELGAGELGFVVGESGSGKSTLLSVAGGLITPDSGTIHVAGEELTDDNRAAVRRDHIGIIFQQANLIGSLTAAEQLLVTDHIRGTRPRRDRADELLDRVGLAGLGDRPIGQLSGGQRQRVGIARALMGEPELVLADEPTSALDSRSTAEVVELIRDLVRDTGVACMFVTHDRSLLREDDRVITVADGQVLEPQLI
ncbi:ABC transporter ATP-binding protein [Corynebacterium pilosum]|uniref:ABC transporter system involved in hemin toxicity ATP-binding protein n=1 Tax=Corynebacterium pilosum TaxID=35756 RepID=A0A376CLW9_9CORY|nr:ABC transporter ATP-binding protein [Corynebacterium pilosum]STC69109.1 ABC transporter system involved in hemin toxicity ATP-binding protein [Corynebacterium pilosum]